MFFYIKIIKEKILNSYNCRRFDNSGCNLAKIKANLSKYIPLTIIILRNT